MVSATEVPRLITSDMVAEGAVVVDLGTGFVEGKLVGDVDFENVSQKASAVTPVPGGVGQVTLAMLISNLVKCASRLRRVAANRCTRIHTGHGHGGYS